MSNYYNAVEMSPVLAPGPEATAPERFEGIYRMPSFVTIPTSDLTASVDFTALAEAGTGTDAQPFFRIFNPETQAKRFDPDGEYVRRWAPALSAPPIVDLKESRQAALDAYAEIKD